MRPNPPYAPSHSGLLLATLVGALLHAAFILGLPRGLIVELRVQPVQRALRINLIAAQVQGEASPPPSQVRGSDTAEPPTAPPPGPPAPVKPKPTREEPKRAAATPVAPTEIVRPEAPPAVETIRAPAARHPPKSAEARPRATPEPPPAAPPVKDPLALEPVPGDSGSSAPASAANLISRGLAMARSESGITGISPSPQPSGLRRKHVSSTTRDPKYSAYVDSWVKKVERIGNLNYPEEARKARLSGTLVLDVSIRADGTVAAIELLRSSGQRELDEAALRILRLGEPYAPLPADIRAETDVLHITRPWRFSDGSRWGSD